MRVASMASGLSMYTGKQPWPVDQIFFLYLADEVEQFLGAAHCKARDDHIAAAVEGALQDLRQLCHIVRPRAMLRSP